MEDDIVDNMSIYPFGRDLDRAGLTYDFNVDGSDPNDKDLCDIDEWLTYLEPIEISLTPHKWTADGNTRIATEIQIGVDIFSNGSTACQASLGDLLERTFYLYDDEPEEELEALEKLQDVIAKLISARKFRAAIARQQKSELVQARPILSSSASPPEDS